MFKFKNEEEPLLEYRLAHVSSEQIKHLIEKKIESNKKIHAEKISPDLPIIQDMETAEDYLKCIDYCNIRRIMTTPYLVCIIL